MHFFLFEYNIKLNGRNIIKKNKKIIKNPIKLYFP